MTLKTTAHDLYRDSLRLARHAQELRETARGLEKRAAQLQRASDAALHRAEKTRQRTVPSKC